MNIIEVTNLSKSFRLGEVTVEALRGVTLTIRSGEYVAITGASGSGKSTLLSLLGCLDTPSDGKYCLGGTDVSRLDDNALSETRRDRIGFVFQSFYLVPRLSVLENIELPLFYAGLSTGIRRQRAREMAERVGLGHRLGHRPLELSGGERQRVAIARALVNRPLMLLADEPTGNLDSKTGDEIIKVLGEIWAAGATLIMVTHDEHIADAAQREINLRDGVIIRDSGLRFAGNHTEGRP